MAYTILNGPSSLLTNRVLRLATCWEIARSDGVFLRFTDHDETVQVGLGGQVYTPADGFSASARQRQSALRPANFEARGIISINAVVEDDIRAGRFRNAAVTEIAVDWSYPWAGPIVVSRYIIETMTWNGEFWTAQITSMAARFKNKVGSVYSRTCRWTLGDAQCKAAIGESSLSVAAVVDVLTKFTSTGSFSADFFAYGLLEWTSGANKGIKQEVATFDEATNTYVLRIPTPNPIVVADSFKVIVGCDKTLTQCRDKFDNVLNHGGFPHMPGNDRLIEGVGTTGASIGKKG